MYMTSHLHGEHDKQDILE